MVWIRNIDAAEMEAELEAAMVPRKPQRSYAYKDGGHRKEYFCQHRERCRCTFELRVVFPPVTPDGQLVLRISAKGQHNDHAEKTGSKLTPFAVREKVAYGVQLGLMPSAIQREVSFSDAVPSIGLLLLLSLESIISANVNILLLAL